MNQHGKREQIISYIAPHVSLFPTTYALVFGTRHGVARFAEDILSLYAQGYFKSLLVSGGLTQPGAHSEAWIIFQALIQHGLPKDIIILEERAMNTGENVAFARELMRDLGIRELLLIGKVSSKRRYIMTLRKQWPEIGRICCHGVNYFSCAQQEWWKDQEFRRRVIAECRKIRSYMASGFISEVSIIDGLVR